MAEQPRTKDLMLAIDVGTGSVRAALVDLRGRIVAFRAREHGQIVPRFGWAEQRPRDWWDGSAASIREVLAAGEDGSRRVLAVAACGQMHGTVLVDAVGTPVLDEVQLWNDKRARPQVDAFAAAHDIDALWPIAANPPTVAWPAFKLQWIRDHQPEAYARAATVLMPKDFVNLRLTGRLGMDLSDASCSYLFDARTGAWSPLLADLLRLDLHKLPPARAATQVIGEVSEAASAATGLLPGTPVAAGTSDFGAALLGSGVSQAGLASDITGTSTLITVYAQRPVRDAIVTNMKTADGGWGAFTILDAGGDAMRWARRNLSGAGTSYDDFVALAATAPPGSEGLIFLPYLNGERLGPMAHARAQFFGLTSGHGPAHLQRAVMEGVAFAARRNLDILAAQSGPVERIIASGGGAKTRLWLEMKAAIYDCPILVPAEAEAGVVGCAMIAAVVGGAVADLRDATRRFVRYGEEIAPNPAWRDRHARQRAIFDGLYHAGPAFYAQLDAL